jgi:hypothetical protein
MKEPGLDDRHRDKTPLKAGEIQQKRGDTLNKNLPVPIPHFSPNAKHDKERDREDQRGRREAGREKSQARQLG